MLEQQVESDNQLWFRTLVVFKLTKAWNPTASSTVETPADPASYLKGSNQEFATFHRVAGVTTNVGERNDVE